MVSQPGLFDWPQGGLFGDHTGLGSSLYKVGQQVRYTHYLHKIDRHLEQTWVVKIAMGDQYMLERVDTGIPADWQSRLDRVPLEDWQVENFWACWRAVFCGPAVTWALEGDIRL